MHGYMRGNEFCRTPETRRPVSNFMRAAIYRDGRLMVEKIEKPKIGDDQALLKVTYTGLCGTDVKKIHYNILGLEKDDSRIFGHEIVGEIVDVGKSVNTLSVGDRVAVFHHVPCLKEECQPCQEKKYAQCPSYQSIDTSAGYGKPSGGGFAEYVVLPREVIARGLIKIPAGIDYEEAVFIEPINCILKAIKKFEECSAPIQRGENVAVIGAGVNGLIFVQILKQNHGANVIAIEKNRHRRKKAEEFGAQALKPNDINETVKIKKAIVACASEEAIQLATRIVNEGGLIVYFGDLIPNLKGKIDWNEISRNEKPTAINSRMIKPSYSSGHELHEESARLVFSRQLELKKLVTHKISLYDLAEAVKGFIKTKLYSCGGETTNVLKVLVQPASNTLGWRVPKWWDWIPVTCAAAVMVLMVMSGIASYKEGKRLERDGKCSYSAYSFSYTCEKDVGEIFGAFKVEKDGKIHYNLYLLPPP